MNQPVQKTVWRKLDGIIILDKAQGSTSNKVLQIVKRLFAADKAGHTGSLDPLATGVLPICFGEATKVSQYLLDSDKSYIARIKLGVATTTSDAEGDVVSTHAVPALGEDELKQLLATFVGEIQQSPSIYSALKQNGVPLYKLARAGKEIIPKLRTITIYSIKLLEWQSPELVLDVSCSKGTYIRTLAEDIGKALGCGGHITQLRRSKAGPFTLAEAHTLEQLQAISERGFEAMDQLLVKADQAIDWMPALELDAQQTRKLQQGQAVVLAPLATDELVRVYSAGKFIGIASIGQDGILKVVRLMQYEL
jgi:tRNA pseudouridine55 synthase